MNIFNSFLFISIILSVIPALLSKGFDECGKQAGKCNFDFHTNSTQEVAETCREIIETLECAREGCICSILNLVQGKERISIVCGLFAYRRIEKALDGDFIRQCGLRKFLQEFPTPVGCRDNPSLLKCVRSYADNVILNEDNNAEGDAKCQALKDYADCQLKWSGAECNVTNSTVSEFARGEMERQNLKDCEIEGLNLIKPTTHAISTNSTQNSTDSTDSTGGANGPDQLGLLAAIVMALAARLLTLTLK